MSREDLLLTEEEARNAIQLSPQGKNPLIENWEIIAQAQLDKIKSLGCVQLDPNRPKVICLCGSGRFKDAFEKAEFEETLRGNIVLTIGCNTHDIARTEELKHHKPMLDELHLRKIDLADEVLILNIDGYIGESTRNELEYARKQGKKITYIE